MKIIPKTKITKKDEEETHTSVKRPIKKYSFNDAKKKDTATNIEPINLHKKIKHLKKKKLNTFSSSYTSLVSKEELDNYKTDEKNIKDKNKKVVNIYYDEIKPYMDYLGILKFNAFPLTYYTGGNKIFIVETDFLETYILKIYPSSAYKYKASIEKHFIVNAKNISKVTPNINVAHDPDTNLSQFLFTDRRPGGNKKWDSLNADEKSEVIREIGKILFKIHTYSSKRTLKENIYGQVSDPKKDWKEYLEIKIKQRINLMKANDEDTSKIIKFQKNCESNLISIYSQKIESSLLHGSISLNKKGIIRSLLFIGTKISAVLNTEESIYGDKIWDLTKIHTQLLSNDPNIEKDFFREYGKLKPEEKERLEFYKTIQ